MNNIHNKMPLDLKQFSKSELIDYFVNTWQLTELLFSSIKSVNTYYSNPEPQRHPLIFYFSHVAAFYINKLRLAGLLNQPINKHYERLFAKGVDPRSARELNKINRHWPTFAEISCYRQDVYEAILQFLNTTTLSLPINQQSPLWAFFLGLEHERLHFETSSMLIRQLHVNDLERPTGWRYASSTTIQPALPSLLELITIPSMSVELGKKNNDTFGWDNEFGYLKACVPEFHVGKNLITNDEYKQFVDCGDYLNKRFWSTKGWSWRTKANSLFPKFWIKMTTNGYHYRALFDQIEFPARWPVEVNFYEAEAYCKWLGSDYRMMTELEFMAVLKLLNIDETQPNHESYNIHFKYGSPSNVGEYSTTKTQTPLINDVRGNVWQWLNNNFYPLPGFKPHPYYLNFSLPYFNQAHALLMGGSWITTGNSAEMSYRLWFRKHFYQHAGFRVCSS